MQTTAWIQGNQTLVARLVTLNLSADKTPVRIVDRVSHIKGQRVFPPVAVALSGANFPAQRGLLALTLWTVIRLQGGMTLLLLPIVCCSTAATCWRCRWCRLSAHR